MARVRFDDAIVFAAMAVTATLCVWFRYLPMTDLPQHGAMVSIIAHRDDPAYGFADRYVVDLGLRPYSLVYALGAALAHVLPLRLALALVVAVCTVAPALGTWLLLRAAGRPGIHAVLPLLVAFGNAWHWGFLNFLLGVGLAQAGAAVAIRAGQRADVRSSLALGTIALVTYSAHIHAFALLALAAPALVLGFAVVRVGRALLPLVALVPAAAIAVAFVFATWRGSHGYDTARWLGPVENLRAFPDHLAAGFPSPWPLLVVLALAAILVGSALSREREDRPPPRARVALAVVLAIDVVLYFALPLNLSTVSYISPRQALVVVLAAAPLLPRPRGLLRFVPAVLLASSLCMAGVQLAAFDREARAFDDVLRELPPNRRIASAIIDKQSRYAHGAVFPYLHFAAWYQADKGGDLSFSFASHWNIPVKYRPGYRRPLMPANVEWRPDLPGPEELAAFDYLLVRSDGRWRVIQVQHPEETRSP